METRPADAIVVEQREHAAVALSLIEIAAELNTMRARGVRLPRGPIMDNHIGNLLQAASRELAAIVPHGEFYIHQYKDQT